MRFFFGYLTIYINLFNCRKNEWNEIEQDEKKETYFFINVGQQYKL